MPAKKTSGKSSGKTSGRTTKKVTAQRSGTKKSVSNSAAPTETRQSAGATSPDDAGALRNELDKVRKSPDRLATASEDLKTSLAELKSNNAELATHNKELGKRVKELDKKSSQLASQNSRLERDHERLTGKNTDLLKKANSLKTVKGELDQLAKEKQTVDRTLEKISAELKSSRKELAHAHKTVERSDRKIEKSQAQLDKTRQDALTKNKELAGEAQGLQDEITTLRSDLETTRALLAKGDRQARSQTQALTRREKSLKSATEELRNLRSKLAEATTEHRELKARHEETVREIGESQQLSELVQQENTAGIEERRSLESSLNELRAQRDELQQATQNLRSQNEHLTRSNGGLMTTNEELASANRGAIESQQKLAAANEELAMNCEGLEEASEHLKQKLKKVTLKHSDLSEKRQELEATVRDLTAAKDEMEEARDDYQNQAVDLAKRLRELGLELQDRTIESDDLKRREEVLESDVTSAQKLVDTAGTNIIVVNKNHKLTVVNRKACELLGECETELLGQDWFDVFVPESIRAENSSVFSEILAGDLEPTGSFEYPVLTQDGQRLVSWRVAVLEDETGASAGALLTGEDITERREAERGLRTEKDRVTRLADAFPVLISYVDADEKYQFVNAACEKWLELDRDSVLGKEVSGVVGDPAYEVLRGYIENALSGWQVSFDKEIVYKNGKKRYVQAVYVPHFGTGDKVLGFYELVTDITERKDAEIEFRNHAERLQDQLKIQSEEAHAAQEKAARESRQRREIERQLTETREILQGILSNRSITLSRIDENGIFTRSVGSGLANWGLKDDQLVGVNAFEVYPDLRDTLRQALRGEEVQFIDEGTYEDGRTQEERSIFLQSYLFPDRVAGKGMFCLSIDITDFVEPNAVE